MKAKILIAVLFITLLVSFNQAEAFDPLTEAACQAGGEFGNVITLKLSKDFRYGNLVIKRAKGDLTKDLSTFPGGNYRLDVATKGGISGYSIQYSAKDATELSTGDGSLNCAGPGEIPTDITQPGTPTPPSTPAPSSTAPSAPSPTTSNPSLAPEPQTSPPATSPAATTPEPTPPPPAPQPAAPQPTDQPPPSDPGVMDY